MSGDLDLCKHNNLRWHCSECRTLQLEDDLLPRVEVLEEKMATLIDSMKRLTLVVEKIAKDHHGQQQLSTEE